MTALAFDFERAERAREPAATLTLVPAPTLDAVVTGTWSALRDGFAACPVCHEQTMTARWTAGHGLAGGRCASCNTTLD
jgi:hypothetical protein